MIIRLRNQYIIDYIIKYRTGNLIILYYYIYSELSDIAEYVVQNSMRLMRSIRIGSWVDRFGMKCNLYWKSGKCTDVRWYIILVESI